MRKHRRDSKQSSCALWRLLSTALVLASDRLETLSGGDSNKGAQLRSAP